MTSFKRSKKRQRLVKNISTYTVLAIVGLIMVVPTFIMITSSFKSYDEYYSDVFKLLPGKWIFDNYVRIFTTNDYIFRWVFNTLILLVSNTVIVTFSTILIAYGFSKYKSKISEVLFMVLLSTMMIPWAVTMIPSYVIWAKLGLVNTYWPLILPSIGGSAYYTFMLRQNMRGIPNEMLESAEIDGATSWQRLWKIVVPNCTPAIITMVLFTSMGIWGDYLGPSIYLRKEELYNISVGLNSLRVTSSSASTGGRTDAPMLLASSVLMAIPSIVMYFIGTRAFTKGISLQGSDK